MALDCPISSAELNSLFDVLTDALDIEKCSICLEKIENAVLLWPCTHWFCKDCIAQMHQSNQTDGRKMLCPLCKKSAARRKVLTFDDQQKEYSDCLQSLIGALSLDLGFDITSYKKQETSCKIKTKPTNLEPNKDKSSSPVRKTKRIITRTVVDKLNNDNNIRITKKSNKHLPLNSKTSKTPIQASPPRTPSSPADKEIKVKKWLNATRFSQAEEGSSDNIVVVDVHKSENYSLVSEEQLQSVTQLDSKQNKTPFTKRVRKKPPNTPSDIDAIRPFNTSTPVKSDSKNIKDTSLMDPFDELVSEKRKFQTIKTTYGDNNLARKRRRVVLESDIFKSAEANEKVFDSEDSQKSLEDFSSGSGEEWTMDMSKKHNEVKPRICTKKVTPRKKPKKGKDSVVKRPTTNIEKRNVSFEKSSKRNTKQNPLMLKHEKTEIINANPIQKNTYKLEGTLDSVAKHISADWDDSVDVAEDKQSKTCDKSLENDILKEPIKPTVPRKLNMQLTPRKEAKYQRSPGWSRLKSTKKEFHMSEKKKLSLKTLNKSKSPSNIDLGIKPISEVADEENSKEKHNDSNFNLKTQVELKKCALQKSTLEKSPSGNECSFQPNYVKLVEKSCDAPQRSILGSFNTSVSSSSSDSPFEGFTSFEERNEVVKRSVLQDYINRNDLIKRSNSFQPASKK